MKPPKATYVPTSVLTTEKPNRESHMTRALSNLTAQVVKLEAVGVELRARLEAVLREEPAEPAAPEPPRELMVPMAESFQALAARIGAEIARLGRTLDQLEV